MLNKLIAWAVNNRLIILLALVAVIIAGAFIIPKLNLDAFPDVTNVQVTINTEASGLAAKEVEQLITYPIEAVMYALPDIQDVRSISKTGLSVVTVVFKDYVDINLARQLVFQRLQTARSEIPPDIGTPKIGPNTSGLGQVYQYVLVSNNPKKYDAYVLRSINDWLVKLMLIPASGVTDVLSFGGKVLQYQVQLNPERLLAYHLSSEDVVKAIQENDRNAGGWYLDQGAEQLVIRGEGWLPSGKKGLTAIGNIPVKEKGGVVVRVKDVAKVAFGAEIRQGAVSMMLRNQAGKIAYLGDVVTGIVLKQMGANTKATIDGIKSRLNNIVKSLPAGVALIPLYDQTLLVNKAIHTVVKALLEAFFLVLIVLFLFLMNLRATLLVILSIPISVAIALMVMAHWKVSANLMSLGGLAIAIGLLVDGSVVMLENIFKHLNKGSSKQESDVSLQIQEAAREVARPVFFAVLIIVTVFAPLFALQGVEGKLFQPMAQTIIIAMLASILVALLVIPALASFLFRKGLQQKHSFILKPLQKGYHYALNFALCFPKRIIFGAITLFVIVLLLFPFLGREFAPQLEEGALNIRVTLAPSASLTTSMQVAKALEQQLMTFPEVTYAQARVGRPELGGDPEPVSNIEILVGLKPASEWKGVKNRTQLEELMEKKLSAYPGLLFNFSQPIATRVDELLSGVKAQLAIKLFGHNLKTLAQLGQQLQTLVQNVKGTSDVAMEPIKGESQLVIVPDRNKLMRYGLSVNQVMSLVSDAIGGEIAGQVIQGNERYNIYVRLAKPYRDSVSAISRLILTAPNGAWVRLSDVAKVSIESGPPQIRRDDVRRRVVIQANVEGRDMGSVVSDIKRQIAQKLKLPSGYTVTYGGQFENQRRAEKRLLIVVPLSLVLIFILLYFAFHSFRYALLIMLNVPLALIGGVIALFISGQYLSVPSAIGFIALFGVAMLNGVVLVNAINQNVKSGMPIANAVFQGATSRLRPVLMTALTASLALIPLLLSHGIGSEVQRPLATVMVGGLISSMLLTLFVLPVLYLYASYRFRGS